MDAIYGDGIERTNLKWEDVQEKVKEIWGENAVFGENKSSATIGEGRGFMSKMCLIDPDWKEPIVAPKKFVLKIPSLIAMASQVSNMMMDSATMEAMKAQIFQAFDMSIRKMHFAECHTYNLIKKYEINVPHVKVHAAVPFDEKQHGFLIMDYVENSLNLNMYDTISIEDIKQALHGIATMEVASLNFIEEDIEPLKGSPFKEIFEKVFNPQTMSAFVGLIRQFASHRLGDKVDQLEKILQEIADLDDLTTMSESLGMKDVLVHGDCWSNNFLWTRKEGTDELSLSAVIDFQQTHMGFPAFDLFRCFGACLSGKDRQAHMNELLETFYDYLLENLNGSPAPYTLDQLKENMRRYTPFGGFCVVVMIGPLFQMSQMNPDEKARAMIEEKVMEKIECLLDDILKEHAVNMEKKKNKK